MRGKSWVNNHAHILTSKPGYDLKWIFYSLVHKNILPWIKGTTRTKLNQSELRKIVISIPPLYEQHTIASILLKVDELIQKTDQVIEQTQRLKKGLMQTLLTKGIEQTRFKRTAIGDIPIGWDIAKLENISKVSTGNTPSTLVKEYYIGNIAFIRTAEITNRVIRDAVVHISKEAVDKCSLEVYPPKTVLLAMYGQGKTRGQSALLDISAATSQNAAAIIVNEDKLDPLFLWYYLLFSYEELRGVGNIGQISHLNLNFVKKLVIPLPALEEQRRITLILSQISHKIENEINSKRKMEELKKGLMQKLLTDKIRVKI